MDQEELVADTWTPEADDDNGGWAVRTPPKVVEELPNPFDSDDFGRLNEPCMDCGGTHGHKACCPVGVEEESRFLANPRRIRVIRTTLKSGKYDPRDQMTAQAADFDRMGTLEASLHEPGDWSRHYRMVAARLDEIMPPRDQDPEDLSETFMKYLARRPVEVPAISYQRRTFRTTKAAKAKESGLFDNQSNDSLGDE